MAESLKVEVGLEGSDQLQADLTKLGQAFKQLGGEVAQFAASFAEIAAIAGAAAIVAAASAVIKFSKAVEETNKQLTQLQKVSGANFQQLSGLQQVFEAGGTSLNKFVAQFGNLSEEIQKADIARYTRQWGDWDKEFTKSVNDLDLLRGKFDSLAAGQAQTFSKLSTFQNQVEALKESLAKVADPQAQLFKLADIFRTLSQQGAQGVALMERFGKALGLSPEFINTLSQGSAAMKALQAETERLGLTLTTSNQQALQQMAQGWNQFSALVSAALQKIAAAAAPAFANLPDIAKQALSRIVQDFETLPLDQAIANLPARLGPVFTGVFEQLSPIVVQGGMALGVALVDAFASSVRDAFSTIFSNLGSELEQNWEILKENIRRGAADLGLGGGGTAGGAGFAGGGLIGGYGTGTSDSNLAWVSRGEHIMPAAAVAQPGVLAFLEALRRSGGNLSRVLDGLGRFAFGGLVPRSIPAFVDGGLVGGMSSVTIHFPGVPPISGLRASSEVVGELQRAAALAQVRSGGRKPSRYS